MKTILWLITVIITAAIIVAPAMILDYRQGIEIEILELRIELLELKLTTFKADMEEYKVEIDNKTRPFTHIIPIDKAYLGIREEE